MLRQRLTLALTVLALAAVMEGLMSAPGRLLSRERILANVWGTSEDPLTNVVDVYIRRLRSKIDDGHASPLIHTLRGLGYRMEDLGGGPTLDTESFRGEINSSQVTR